MDRPSQRVIEDDDLFDSWLLRQHEEIDRRTRKKETDDLLKRHQSAKKGGRQEVFILTDQKGAKDVYGMNDPKNRASIRRKQQIIAKRGKIKEAELPESRAEMRAQIMAAQREQVHRGKPRGRTKGGREAMDKQRTVVKTRDSEGNDLERANLRPGNRALQEGQRHYNLKLADLVRRAGQGHESLISRHRLDEYLKKIGVWTAADQVTFQRTNLQVRECELELKQGGIKLSEARQLALQSLDKALHERLVDGLLDY